MKKLIYILFALSLVCSCSESEIESLLKEEGITLTVFNNIMTKASDPGTDYERQLNTLDVFFYPKGQTSSPCVFYHHEVLNGNVSGQAEIKINVLEDVIRTIFPTENTCDVFIIANLPDYLTPEDSDTFAPGSEHTTLELLQKYILKLDDETDEDYVPMHDMVDKPFVMAGLGTAQKDSKRNATGSISVRRAASKVTLSVIIPDYLDVEVTNDGVTETVRMVPTFEDAPAVQTINAAFHNGAAKGYLYNEADAAVDGLFIASSKKTFKYSHSLPEETDPETSKVIPSRRVYECEVPFYTYAREWVKGDADAPYMTFEMKWGAQREGASESSIKYDTYYYQILVNGPGLCFEPNRWYDLTVNVGVLGSTIELQPIFIDHLSFFVLDWSDVESEVNNPMEDVDLNKYVYLNVDTPFVEIENVPTGLIQYNASDPICWNIEEAYIFNNRGNTPQKVNYTNISNSNFNIDTSRNGVLMYTHEIPDGVYSPIYITLTIWLDLDGEKDLDEDEEEFQRTVEIIQYPMMYVVMDESCLRSIYVNGARASYTSNSTQTTSISGYPLGNINGVRDFSNGYQNVNYSMYVIHVSSFDSDDEFQAPLLNNGYFQGVNTGRYNNGSHTEPAQPSTVGYDYIIGDPRSRSIDNGLGGGDAVAQAWTEDLALYDKNSAKANAGYSRGLAFYYPTESEGESFRVVAPKFRIVSFNNASGKNCTHHSAAMRCASLQEDGFPAGRWRLPTVAEIQYIILLQEAQAIQEIFSSTGSYYATASYSDAGHTKRIAVAYRDRKLSWNSLNANISVRCVYDEWYWGSNRDAVKNPGTLENLTINGQTYNPNEYLFTWGDREIIW